MKPQHFFYCLAIIAIIFTACKKETDYRDKWTGTYEFTTHDFVEGGYYPNPWTVSLDTTIYFTGTIKKFGKDRLKITFKSNAKEPGWDPDPRISTFTLPIYGLIFPRVCNLGDLDYPEFRCDKGGFEGSFSNNEVSIKYWQSAGHYGYENYTIQGIKINKK